jgi:cyclopropane fatty-acyl-phospholipid synthase-like methyltransferase
MAAAWFESWFDSPYYHILYQHRDDREAEVFIDHLFAKLDIKSQDSILDLACGAGRHAIYMASKGNQVTGIDLAPNSIKEAQLKSENRDLSERLQFSVEDMRSFELTKKFDYIFNLFTSFGYFEKKAENEKVLICSKNHLNKNGILVIDYLNSQLVRANGEESYTKSISGIDFTIKKYFDRDFVIKEIEVNDQGKISKFREQVQLFELEEIQTMLENLGFQVINHFGDYKLGKYKANSPRSLVIAKKL